MEKNKKEQIIEENVKATEAELEEAEKEMGLSIHVQREEIFTSMHRI